METTKRSLLILAITALALCAGCVSTKIPGSTIAVKSTVLGFDVSADPSSQIPHVRIGLIRNVFLRVPVATNRLESAPFATSMSADMRLTSQQGQEEWGTGDAALGIVVGSNSVGKIGAAVAPGSPVILGRASAPVATAPATPVTSTNVPPAAGN